MRVRPEIQADHAVLDLRGVLIVQGFLGPSRQVEVIEEIRDIAKRAPLFSPSTRRGGKMSVAMTSAGKYGWFSDVRGYRYEPRHPAGGPWPPIPAALLDIWHALIDARRDPDCCLINHYAEGARMGMHRDNDEADFGWPVVSVSLGDDGLFRVGNPTRGGKTGSVWLKSGDVAILAGPARRVYHGVDRIRFRSSQLLRQGGRINLTMRVVD